MHLSGEFPNLSMVLHGRIWYEIHIAFYIHGRLKSHLKKS